jgi:hypothetical protein
MISPVPNVFHHQKERSTSFKEEPARSRVKMARIGAEDGLNGDNFIFSSLTLREIQGTCEAKLKGISIPNYFPK